MKTYKVCLDPGHYKGYNTGYNRSYAEGTAMFDYAYMLKSLLEACGVQVIVTRKNVTDNPALTTRGSMAKGCDLFVSLHSNGVDNPQAYGVSTFYSIKRDIDKKAAQDWCDRLAKLIVDGTRSRGATTRKGGGDWDYYTVIQYAIKANCPHVFLIEHGFHSNPKECEWLMKAENMKKMAELECKIICEQLGIKPSGSTTPVNPAPAPKPEPEKVAYATGMVVNCPGDTLNVRKEAIHTAKKLGELEHQSVVSVVGTASNGWKCVTQGKLKGWVNASYLRSVASTKKFKTTNTPKDTLNMRTVAVYTASKIAEIPDKTEVPVFETLSNGWCLVCYGGEMGWVNGAYLK